MATRTTVRALAVCGDLTGHTQLYLQLGDDAAADAIQRWQGVVNERLPRSALPRNWEGDGFVTAWPLGGSRAPAVADVIDSLVGLSIELYCHHLSIPPQCSVFGLQRPTSQLCVAAGLAAGLVCLGDNPAGRSDYYGTPINIAAKVCDCAKRLPLLCRILVHHSVPQAVELPAILATESPVALRAGTDAAEARTYALAPGYVEEVVWRWADHAVNSQTYGDRTFYAVRQVIVRMLGGTV